MNCYGRPLCATSFKVKLLQHEGAPQIVANKQELDGGTGSSRRDELLKMSIASPMPELLLRAPGFIVTVRQWKGHVRVA